MYHCRPCRKSWYACRSCVGSFRTRVCSSPESSAFERVGDVERDVGLDGEDVVELPVVRLGPEVAIGLGVDELRDDAHAIAGATYAAVEQRGGAERRADLAQALRALLERHDRVARDHLERADLGEMRDDVLGDAVGEVLVLRIGAQVAEGKHGDGGRARARRRRRDERRGELADGGEAVGGDLGEGAHDRLVHRRGDGVAQPAHGGHRIHQPLGDDRGRRRAAVRRLAGEQLVQHAGEAVLIAATVGALVERLLGAHVLRRADDESRAGDARRLRGARGERDAEVGDHRLALVDEDVLRLDVAMDDVARVRVVERRRDLPRDGDGVVDREIALAVEPVAERLALEEGHDVEQLAVGVARVEQRDDVRMAEPRGDLDLAQEALGPDGVGELGLEELDGDLATVAQVVGEIDGRHPAAADHALDAVAAGERRTEA